MPLRAVSWRVPTFYPSFFNILLFFQARRSRRRGVPLLGSWKRATENAETPVHIFRPPPPPQLKAFRDAVELIEHTSRPNPPRLCCSWVFFRPPQTPPRTYVSSVRRCVSTPLRNASERTGRCCHGRFGSTEVSEEREVGRGAGFGQELRRETGLLAVRRTLHLRDAQPREVLQAALVLPPGMVSL